MDLRTKQHLKQLVRQSLGEPYVGKRLKMHYLDVLISELNASPLSILDAGSEDATFVYWLADHFPDSKVLAVDIDQDAVSSCLANRPFKYRDQVTFQVGSFAEVESESVDLITAFDVLEHILDDRGAVAELARALRPGGSLLVHVPRDQWTTRQGLVHHIADEDAWKINPGHVRQGYSPDGLRGLLEGADLEVVDLRLRLGKWSVLAFEVYNRLEHPLPLRLLSIPITDVCARLDRNVGEEGNALYAHAVKPK